MLEYSMIPLFKSTYSIGKSILTLDDPAKAKDGGADSILSIALENKLDKIVLVEDSMIGFLDAHTKCQEHDIQLIFGLRINCCNNRLAEDRDASKHKLVVLAKNDDGVKALTRIYSLANQESGGFVDCAFLEANWSPDLMLCIPFYDSFIYNNNFKGMQCLPIFPFTDVTLFVEDNDLPFDQFILEKVSKWAQNFNATIQKTKSIYYKDRKDFDAWQTYKCLCNRSFGKQQSLSNPNLEHCGSDSFCWQAFQEYEG